MLREDGDGVWGDPVYYKPQRNEMNPPSWMRGATVESDIGFVKA
jgi:hypothetical protein